jgi:hypothetical protein
MASTSSRAGAEPPGLARLNRCCQPTRGTGTCSLAQAASWLLVPSLFLRRDAGSDVGAGRESAHESGGARAWGGGPAVMLASPP